MEVMLEIGLMSDIFMNWRRAKSDIFYFSSCKSMKKMHLFFLNFSNDVEIRYLKKGEKLLIGFQPFQILTWKDSSAPLRVGFH